jgi:hypothetical protein
MANNLATKTLATAIKLAVASGLVALLVWGGCGVSPVVRYIPPKEENLPPSSFVESSEPNWQRIQLMSDRLASDAWKRLKTIVRNYNKWPGQDLLLTEWNNSSGLDIVSNTLLHYRVRAIFSLTRKDNILRFKVEAQFMDEANGKWIYGYDTDVLMTVAKDVQLAIGE